MYGNGMQSFELALAVCPPFAAIRSIACDEHFPVQRGTAVRRRALILLLKLSPKTLPILLIMRTITDLRG